MERKRDNTGRFRLGSEMEETCGVKRLKPASEIKESHSDKCQPNFLVPAIGEPFVKYKRPRHDFEKWDWMLFQWPHDRADANFEMTNKELDASFEADKKRFEEIIERKQRQKEKQQIEPPLDKPNDSENSIQNFLRDYEFCLMDAST